MAWIEGLNIELPEYWMEPAKVTSLLPPYYDRVVKEYVEWMQQPHSSLKDLSWGGHLNFLYRPHDPAVKERETKNPTTYFVYEGIYTLFAGLVTETIPPKDQLDPDRAGYLRRQLIVNFAEVMQSITELGTGKISFDQEYNIANKTYRLAPPDLRNRGRHSQMNTFTCKECSMIAFNFKTAIRSFVLVYDELDNLRFLPAEINGGRASFTAVLRLDRSRPSTNERRLMLDFDIRKLLWDWRSDGRCLPIAAVSLTDEFFGKNKHHINLATLTGNIQGQYDIDSITQTVITELGLSRLFKPNPV